MNLTVTEAQEDDTLILHLRGEMDVYTGCYLKEQVMSRLDSPEYAGLKLALDLREVEYLDACGLGVLLGSLKRCRERERDFSVRSGNERVRWLFQRTGVNKIIPNSWTPAGAMQ